jgi:hypothetical protein
LKAKKDEAKKKKEEETKAKPVKEAKKEKGKVEGGARKDSAGSIEGVLKFYPAFDRSSMKLTWTASDIAVFEDQVSSSVS